MNRRKFLTSTALALPSVAVLGAISTQPTKTYRSAASLFTNEELTEWCAKNGGHYAQDDELVYAYYQTSDSEYNPKSPNAYKDPYKSFGHLFFNIPNDCDKYEALNRWLVFYSHKYGSYRFIIKDIYCPDYVIENTKTITLNVPFIASIREYPNKGKSYGFGSPIFDIKSHKYIVPTFENLDERTLNFTGFKSV